MTEIAIFIFSVFAGLFVNISVRLGFKPQFTQPRNFRIQLMTGLVAISLMVLVVSLIFKTEK
jgi:hypothetical protein